MLADVARLKELEANSCPCVAWGYAQAVIGALRVPYAHAVITETDSHRLPP